jgi:hypothetical protein
MDLTVESKVNSNARTNLGQVTINFSKICKSEQTSKHVSTISRPLIYWVYISRTIIFSFCLKGIHKSSAPVFSIYDEKLLKNSGFRIIILIVKY